MELKHLLRLRFKPKRGEDTPTKHNRLLFTIVECLQGAFLAMHIQNGFARAGIYPFSKETPLNSALIKHAQDEIDFQPAAKRAKITAIGGKVLTEGNLPPLAIAPSALATTPLVTATLSTIIPVKSTLSITFNVPPLATITDFINL
jgi:hypothetical protein